MRIAYLADANTPNGFYRGVGPMDNLAYRGHEVRQLSRYEPARRFAAVRDVAVLHIHRHSDEVTLRLLREAKAHGAAIVWDNDDDFGAFEKGTISHLKDGGLAWERRLKRMKAIFELADVVSAPSAPLTERLRGYGARHTAVIENQIPGLFLLPRDRRPHTGVTVGWLLGGEHQLDVERLGIDTTLQRLLDERSDVNVLTIGLNLGLRGERYRHIKKVGVLDLANNTALFDIAIAPLADVPFNRARSNVKLKEYAAGGAPWLASPVGPYAGMGEQEGGRLVGDDRWHEAIVRLVEKPKERAKLAKRGAKWVAGETLECNGHVWEALFADAIERSRSRAA